MTIQKDEMPPSKRVQRDDAVPLLGPQYRLIGVNRLTWDLNNYRIGPQENAREALKAMIERLPDELIELGRHLTENGPDRSLLMIVTPDPTNEGQYVVLEGNRRLTALKLLENPDRAKAVSSRVAAAFKELIPTYKENGPILEFLCIVSPDRKSSRLWVDLRHLGKQRGKGLMEWGRAEKARRQRDFGHELTHPHFAILEHMRERGRLQSIKDSDLDGIASTLDRVFGSRPFRQTTGIKVNKDWTLEISAHDTQTAYKVIERVFEDFLSRSKDVTDVYKGHQRKKYISDVVAEVLAESGKPALNDDSRSNEGHASTGEHQSKEEADENRGCESGPSKDDDSGKRGHKPKRDSLKRPTLAPTDPRRTMVIHDPWVNKLYGELRKLNPSELSGCGGVMLRVFLETLTELFLETVQFKIPNGKDSWSASGINLNTKVRTALHILDPERSNPDLDNARIGESDDDVMHSIYRLHKFVHNSKVKANARELKETWDRWEDFFVLMCTHGGL